MTSKGLRLFTPASLIVKAHSELAAHSYQSLPTLHDLDVSAVARESRLLRPSLMSVGNLEIDYIGASRHLAALPGVHLSIMPLIREGRTE